MKVKIPEKWDSQLLREAMRDFLFDFLGKERGYLVFEGSFGFGIPNDQLAIGVREIREFAKELKVEGGTKSIKNRWLFVKPYCNRDVHLLLPKEHYELIKRYARETKTKPSTVIQDAVGEKIFRWMEAKKKKSEKEESAVGYA